MNLLGHFSKNKLTLDKLNRSIRKLCNEKMIDVKIFQTHDMGKHITLMQRNRNKVDAMILNLGPWHAESHVIHSTLSVLNLPYFLVEDLKQSEIYLKNTLFNKKYIISNLDIQEAYLDAINKISE